MKTDKEEKILPEISRRTFLKGSAASAIGLASMAFLGGPVAHAETEAEASPSEEAFDTINDSPDAITFSWDFDTIPVNVEGTNFKPTACLVVDSRYANATKLATLLQTLYGTAATVGDNPTPAVDPRLPSPSEVITALTPGQ